VVGDVADRPKAVKVEAVRVVAVLLDISALLQVVHSG
jgi:hypothetical protein